jgi:hypothetical protein
LIFYFLLECALWLSSGTNENNQFLCSRIWKISSLCWFMFKFHAHTNGFWSSNDLSLSRKHHSTSYFMILLFSLILFTSYKNVTKSLILKFDILLRQLDSLVWHDPKLHSTSCWALWTWCLLILILNLIHIF